MGFSPLGTLLVLMCSTSGSVASFVTLKCNPDNHGRVCHQSLLNCTVSLSEEAENTQIMEVIWMKEGTEIPLGAEIPLKLLQYNASGEHQLEPRFTFAEPHWKVTMNVSMLVTETKIADIGKYRCFVVTNGGESGTSTSLSVSGPYRAPTISSVMEDKRVTSLSCNASGGYPKGTIHWFDENSTRLTPRHEQNAIPTGDGLFNLTSMLDRPPDSAFYTCVVNGTGGQEGEARYPPAEFRRG
ncbi:hypothetical protein CRUP_018054, partial [Coryphaenoides rupestris]